MRAPFFLALPKHPGDLSLVPLSCFVFFLLVPLQAVQIKVIGVSKPALPIPSWLMALVSVSIRSNHRVDHELLRDGAGEVLGHVADLALEALH